MNNLANGAEKVLFYSRFILHFWMLHDTSNDVVDILIIPLRTEDIIICHLDKKRLLHAMLSCISRCFNMVIDTFALCQTKASVEAH